MQNKFFIQLKIKDLIKMITNKLNINSNIFNNVNILNNNNILDSNIDTKYYEEISNLLNSDDKFQKYEDNYIKNDITKKNFNKFKKEIGKLQILLLVRTLEKAKSCEEVVNTILSVLNNKFDGVYDVISDNLKDQTGGSFNKKYYNKYLKLKFKYLTYKYNIINK